MKRQTSERLIKEARRLRNFAITLANERGSSHDKLMLLSHVKMLNEAIFMCETENDANRRNTKPTRKQPSIYEVRP